jgi:hypothetical protein
MQYPDAYAQQQMQMSQQMQQAQFAQQVRASIRPV